MLSGNESVETRHRHLTSSGPEQRQQIQIDFKRKTISKFKQLFSIYSIFFLLKTKKEYIFYVNLNSVIHSRKLPL